MNNRHTPRARCSLLLSAAFVLFVFSPGAMADIMGNSACDPGVPPKLGFGGDAGKGNTCDLFENDANQKARESSVRVTTGNGMESRWLVLLEKGDVRNKRDRELVANWSDVVLIFNSTTIQLFSDSGSPEKFDINNVSVPSDQFSSNSATVQNIIDGKYTSQNKLNPKLVITPSLAGGTEYALEALATKNDANPPTTFTLANTLKAQDGKTPAPPDKFNIFSDPRPVPPAAPGAMAPAPRGGAKDPMMSFDANTGSLSITDGVVDFLNLGGHDNLAPQFSGDPLLGATIHITGLTLAGPEGNGFLFKDGELTIVNGQETFLTADLPQLLIDDTKSGPNVFAPLGITSIDSLASPFLDDFDATWVETNLMPELVGRTVTPVDSLIGSDQSFTVKFNDESIGFAETPEPASGILLVTGLAALGAWVRRRMDAAK
jgi:hypothetical protein